MHNKVLEPIIFVKNSINGDINYCDILEEYVLTQLDDFEIVKIPTVSILS